MRTELPKFAGTDLPFYKELLSEPTNDELLLRLARALLDVDRIALAKDVFGRIIELGKFSMYELVTSKIAGVMGAMLFKKHPELYENMVLSDKALELMRTGKYPDLRKAERMLKDVVSEFPDSYLNWYNLGIVLSKPTGMERKPLLLEFEGVSEIEDEDFRRCEADAHWWEAIAAFFKALSLFPFDPDLLADIGGALSNVFF